MTTVEYTTNNELGFDYLRDNMVVKSQDRVQRGLNFVIIDEVDSVLIDEARTPLIISGGKQKDKNLYMDADKAVKSLKEEDYTVDEMVQIGLFSLKKQQYHVNPSSYADLLKNNLSKDNDNSNGRWVRNLNDKIIKKQAVRVALTDSYSEEDLINITDADLDAVRL